MDLSQFDYDLPQHLIAQKPADQRDESRLLVVQRETASMNDAKFRDLGNWLNPGDVLVLNDTKVFPARLRGMKQPGGALIEMLLLEPKDSLQWIVIAYRASRLKVGTEVVFGEDLKCSVLQCLPEGKFVVQFDCKGDWHKTLNSYGEIPLPPYIERNDNPSHDLDRERYQTVYASHNDQYNSAAAPTAGLHFTPYLLEKLRESGIVICRVTLRVGLDTFLPMRVDHIHDHKMHSEAYFVPESSVKQINHAAQEGKRVVAVGTTSVRVLESASQADGTLRAGPGSSELFIHPGYRFRTVNAMITNFHLPRTTLILLVSAFMGNELRKKVYQHAIEGQYRFYSYGDAMLIL